MSLDEQLDALSFEACMRERRTLIARIRKALSCNVNGESIPCESDFRVAVPSIVALLELEGYRVTPPERAP